MEDQTGCNTTAKRMKRLREILTDEVRTLTREQRAGLLEAADRRSGAFYDPDILSRLQLLKEQDPHLKKIFSQNPQPFTSTGIKKFKTSKPQENTKIAD